MKIVSLAQYGPIIANRATGDEIYNHIHEAISSEPSVNVDMGSIQLMTTYNAEQIFGRLYVEMGSRNYYSKLRLVNASDNVKLTIMDGIHNALEYEKVPVEN